MFEMKRWAQFPILAAVMVCPQTALSQTQGLPDPTRPAEYRETMVMQDLPPELLEWKVTAIRISDNDRTAIVNGRIVRPGDTIGAAKLLEILPYQVILDYDNRKVAVKLFNDMNMRKPAANPIKTESRS